MKVTLEPTDRFVTFRPLLGERVPARIWSGVTDGGVPVHFLVCRIAVPEGLPEQDYAEIERVLAEEGPGDGVNAAMGQVLP